jgi:hypothetical protein
MIGPRDEKSGSADVDVDLMVVAARPAHRGEVLVVEALEVSDRFNGASRLHVCRGCTRAGPRVADRGRAGDADATAG